MRKTLQEALKKFIKKFSKKRAFLKTISSVFSVLLGSFLLILGAYHLAYYNRIYPGIMAAHLPIGNKTVAEAEKEIEKKLFKIKDQNIIFYTETQEWEINLEQIDFEYHPKATAQKAFLVGRNENLIKDLERKSQAWFSRINLNLEYTFDQSLFETQVATIAAQVFIPSIEPQIKIVNQSVKIEPGKEGRELDKRKLIAGIMNQASKGKLIPLKLPLIQTIPTLNENQIELTRQRAEKFLNQKLKLVYQETEKELAGEELINFLSFNNDFNQEKIASLSAALVLEINHPPQNALFQFGGGKVTQFQPAKDGQALNYDETNKMINNALLKMEKTGQKEEEIILLPVSFISPAIANEEVNNLGIKELLGRGVSYYWGSIRSRIHNLTLASNNLNGILISPGEDFSFLQALGEVSPATGYQSAFVIKEGRTILDDGGGVCQVSTTFFRASLNAGLPILERHPHSYRVNYYEQGGFGPGLDATVWIPTVDLKIKNDTPAHILIQAYANPQTKTLIFEFYGTDDNRQVTLSKPRVWDQVAPPPDRYQDDPTLPIGTVKIIERANWGAKASVDWKVIRGSEVLQDRTFYSTYQSWQAVYLRGTKP